MEFLKKRHILFLYLVSLILVPLVIITMQPEGKKAQELQRQSLSAISAIEEIEEIHLEEPQESEAVLKNRIKIFEIINKEAQREYKELPEVTDFNLLVLKINHSIGYADKFMELALKLDFRDTKQLKELIDKTTLSLKKTTANNIETAFYDALQLLSEVILLSNNLIKSIEKQLPSSQD